MRADDGTELILLQLAGGPVTGTFLVRADQLNELDGWPPPERLAVRIEEDAAQFTPLPAAVSEAALRLLDAHVYERISFSQLPGEVANSPRAARSASYREHLAGEPAAPARPPGERSSVRGEEADAEKAASSRRTPRRSGLNFARIRTSWREPRMAQRVRAAMDRNRP